MVQWLIDTDGGIDDVQALVLALRSPMPLLGISLVAGNVPLPQVQSNVLEVLLRTHRTDLPVYPGASRPLVQPFTDAKQCHGEDGLGGYWSKTAPHPLPDLVSKETAAEAIIRLAGEAQGGIGIVTLGPLTNLALALLLDQSLAEKLQRVVVMAGAETGNGNISISAEFNIHWDPEAAHIVFTRLPHIEVLTWEATISPCNAVPEAVLCDYLTERTELGRFLRQCTSPNKKILCDVMAVAVALRRDIVMEWREGWMGVELQGVRGMTIFSHRRPSNVLLVKRLDMSIFSSLILHSVS